jgi:hypothetical protein
MDRRAHLRCRFDPARQRFTVERGGGFGTRKDVGGWLRVVPTNIGTADRRLRRSYVLAAMLGMRRPTDA